MERFGEAWCAPFFQLRGIGQSEPVERLPTLEQQAHDIATVMDEVGLDRAWSSPSRRGGPAGDVSPSGVDHAGDLVERHGALDQHQDPPVMECVNVRCGGCFVESCLDEHLLEVVM